MVRAKKQDNSDEYRKTKKNDKKKDTQKRVLSCMHALRGVPLGVFERESWIIFLGNSVPPMATHFPTPSDNQSSIMLQLCG